MHIILGVLGSVITILILLKKLNDSGFDPSSLNPFLWYRRHKWAQQYGKKAIHTIDKPIDAAAILMVAIAKCDGEMSAEQKQAILGAFEEDFHLTQKEASSLIVASLFMLKDENALHIKDDLTNILAPSRELFSDGQVRSTLVLLKKIAEVEGPSREAQSDLIAAVSVELLQDKEKAQPW